MTAIKDHNLDKEEEMDFGYTHHDKNRDRVNTLAEETPTIFHTEENNPSFHEIPRLYDTEIEN